MLTIPTVALILLHLANQATIVDATSSNVSLQSRASPVQVPITNGGIPVTIGTQTVPLIVDTGAAEVWAFQKDYIGQRTTPLINSPVGHKGSLFLDYASYDLMGGWQAGPVSVGGVTLVNTGFFSAWKFANMKVFSDAMSGSFGMGLPQTSREGFIGGSGTCRTSYLHSGTLCDPFWYLLTTTHGLPGIFGLQLDDDRNGQLTLGSDNIDTTQYGDISWNDLHPRPTDGMKYHWSIDLDGVTFAEDVTRVDGVTSEDESLQLGGKAIMDTGADGIFGRVEAVLQFYATLQSMGVECARVVPRDVKDEEEEEAEEEEEGVEEEEEERVKKDIRFSVDCNAVFGPVMLVFNGEQYPLSSETLIVNDGNNECFGLIRSREATLAGANVDWLIGIPFLKTVYSVWDADNSRLGFARPL